MGIQLIEVTQEDIDIGVAQASRYCPVALAVKRATKKPVMVHPTYVAFESGERVSVPNDVTWWISAFDAGAKGMPFSFALEVPFK